jgi:hypothetical protein
MVNVFLIYIYKYIYVYMCMRVCVQQCVYILVNKCSLQQVQMLCKQNIFNGRHKCEFQLEYFAKKSSDSAKHPVHTKL